MKINEFFVFTDIRNMKISYVSIMLLNLFLLGCDIDSANQMAAKSEQSNATKEYLTNLRQERACSDFINDINDRISNTASNGKRFITVNTNGRYCRVLNTRGNGCLLDQIFYCKEKLENHLIYLKRKGYQVETRFDNEDKENYYYIIW